MYGASLSLGEGHRLQRRPLIELILGLKRNRAFTYRFQYNPYIGGLDFISRYLVACLDGYINY
jgi:hypothetical protein